MIHIRVKPMWPVRHDFNSQQWISAYSYTENNLTWEYVKIIDVHPAPEEIPPWVHVPDPGLVDNHLEHFRNAWMDWNLGRSGQRLEPLLICICAGSHDSCWPDHLKGISMEAFSRLTIIFRWSDRSALNHTLRFHLIQTRRGLRLRPFSLALRGSAVGNKTWQPLGGLPSVSLSGQRSYRSCSKWFNHWCPSRLKLD